MPHKTIYLATTEVEVEVEVEVELLPPQNNQDGKENPRKMNTKPSPEAKIKYFL